MSFLPLETAVFAVVYHDLAVLNRTLLLVTVGTLNRCAVGVATPQFQG